MHRIRIEGLLGEADEWQWTFALKPHHATVEAPGWTVSGLRPMACRSNRSFVRKDRSTAGEACYDRQEFQTIAAIERDLQLGLVWQVQTTVTRLSPRGKPLPLHSAPSRREGPYSRHDRVDGAIEVRLGANDSEFVWVSELPITEKVDLSTKAGDSWVERWRLIVSPVWNLGISGLAPTFDPPTSS